MDTFVVGQRWVSEAEPELGLGTLRAVDGRQVEIEFLASGERRRYVARSAPLKRVRFRVGERVTDDSGRSLVVERIDEDEGLLRYHGAGEWIDESALCAAISPSLPEQRMLSGRLDPPSLFDLRWEALQQRSDFRRASTRGLVGARIALLPHQLSIAEEVASRQAPRVLLADEVGLGKTIEAGLILHRLLHMGRAARILVLVPPSLVHQWLVELLRRFNLWFRIFDEERCTAIEGATPEANPFLDEQLVLASLDLFTSSEQRRSQVVDAPWDLLIVDEAHRLGGGDDDGSTIAYALVASLATRTRAVLLLTATPEQLGRGAHFARLGLLDPHRYTDRAAFEREADSYRVVADFVDRLLDGGPLTYADRSSPLLTEPSGRLLARFDAAAASTPGAREALIDELVDRHGPGRVVVRNTRAAIGGFSARRAHLTPLAWPGGIPDEVPLDYSRDPRIAWLRDLLREHAGEKLLLICRTRAQVEAIGAALARLVNVPTAVFHEQLTLVQRDRNAAYFAETTGARLLLCSEIGGEGRNFQFARHLVLFDLPEDPEVLEQRIGRLDRIGQTHAVEIHVPVLSGSSLAVRARWFHEGLDAFEQSVRGAHELYRRFGTAVEELARRFDRGDASADDLAALIRSSRVARDEVATRLASGRDRLLEQSSFRRSRAAALVAEIQRRDADRELETFLLRLLEHHGVDVDEIAPRTYRLAPLRLTADALPGLPTGGLTATFAREIALAREDLTFLSWDHPLVANAVEMLLAGESGNASFGVLDEGADPALLLEACFVVECVAPPQLALDRFLPPTPLRIVLDQALEERREYLTTQALAGRLQRASAEPLLRRTEVSTSLLPRMLAAATERAEARLRDLRQAATHEMETALGHELERLELLRATGGRVREDEIESARREIADLRGHLAAARLRLDSLRLVWQGPRGMLGASPSQPI